MIKKLDADVTGIPFAELVCIGGRLSRESSIVFKVKNEISTKIIGKEGEQQDGTLRTIVIRTLSFVKVDVSADSKIMIKKFYDEFNTIFMVNIEGCTYVIFFLTIGNVNSATNYSK